MKAKKDQETKPKSFSPAPYVVAGYATIALAFGVFGTWAATAPLASGVVAHGVVVVSGNRKVVQHLEGGIISEILVKEGDIVEPDDVLIRLDRTQAVGNYTVLTERLALLQAAEARLQAESVNAEAIDFPPQLLAKQGAQEEPYVKLQRTMFRDRRATRDGQTSILTARAGQLEEQVRGLESQRKSLEEQRDSLVEQIERMEQGQKNGYVSTNQVAQLMRGRMELEGNLGRVIADTAGANQSIAETKLRVIQLGQEFVERAGTELRETRDQIAEVSERVKQAQDILNRTVIRAPVRGVVQDVRVHTKTGVIRPAEPLMEIVPLDDEFIVNARIRPVDVDNVMLGGTAEVRFPAFSARATPVIFGTVDVVSPDIIQPENPQIEPYYTARITVPETEIPVSLRGRLQAGMPAEIIVSTGERTMIDYLVKPLTDSFSKGMLEE
ncbi:HlyD family type I secretion periplasmic adaptor subunit [Mesorhizobium sp. LHD-90]|uniref:HlyD family type I secretion periplasmic adaptor subunit n=1 Tax=Mesorhizobium sp. LHD-90 TaxID=3071414 RepID=UPI0027E05B62|nr:HlyD family type I secretion periplasmic adaptor subunit [Mesorhizobium sp. LHD-90]MDQ6436226.1 HlyD family type I secretion periplasmic adaptor subunit [Mesorhizobium sp. LHD-90]